MSILGKLGGAAAGFMLGGGPVGALIGALAGHFLIDREMPSLSPGEAPGVVFTIAMIALAAKMAKADGTVTDDEVETFHRLLRVRPHEQSSDDRIFLPAREDTPGSSSYPRPRNPIAPSPPARPRSWSVAPPSSASPRTLTAASALPISAPTRATP